MRKRCKNSALACNAHFECNYIRYRQSNSMNRVQIATFFYFYFHILYSWGNVKLCTLLTQKCNANDFRLGDPLCDTISNSIQFVSFSFVSINYKSTMKIPFDEFRIIESKEMNKFCVRSFSQSNDRILIEQSSQN